MPTLILDITLYSHRMGRLVPFRGVTSEIIRRTIKNDERTAIPKETFSPDSYGSQKAITDRNVIITLGMMIFITK